MTNGVPPKLIWRLFSTAREKGPATAVAAMDIIAKNVHVLKFIAGSLSASSRAMHPLAGRLTLG